MADQTTSPHPSQESVFAAPTFFVDGNLGIATGGGVARITFASYKLNVDPAATIPILHPVVTIAVPEHTLLAFAHQIIERAGQIGVTLEGQI